MDLPYSLGYDWGMGPGEHLSQWCHFRGISLSDLAHKIGIQLDTLESIHNGTADLSISVMNTLAGHLEIPTAWLHYDPHIIQRLWNDPDEDHPDLPPVSASDPVFQRMIQASREYQDLFIMLTYILHHGDPKLIRAAQVSLQSILKQARPTAIPWGSRPPGHFEPPSE